MKGKVLRVESLERRELLTGVCSGPGEPVQVQVCVQVQECAVECPVQTQTQTQTQEQSQLQTQTQTQEQTQLQTQTQEQTQNQLQTQAQEILQTQTQEKLQTEEQVRSGEQVGDCNRNCDANDAAIEILAADDADPLRQRSGDTAHPENGRFIRDRDGVSWSSEP
jgi:hypothetical protein